MGKAHLSPDPPGFLPHAQPARLHRPRTRVWTPRLHVHTLSTLPTESQPGLQGVHVGDVGWREAGRGLGLFGQAPGWAGRRGVGPRWAQPLGPQTPQSTGTGALLCQEGVTPEQGPSCEASGWFTLGQGFYCGSTAYLPGSLGCPSSSRMAAHSSIPAQRMPWTEEHGGLPSRQS